MDQRVHLVLANNGHMLLDLDFPMQISNSSQVSSLLRYTVEISVRRRLASTS